MSTEGRATYRCLRLQADSDGLLVVAESAEIPEVEWLGELRGMEREGQLAAFIASVAEQESKRDRDS